MSNKTLLDQIRHYQKDIERCPDNAERMIRCIQRLYVLPILVEHLQETGIGRSVNALRKYDGEVGDAAKALVAKWKAMVAAEESSDSEKLQEPEEIPAPTISNKSSKSSSSSRSKISNHETSQSNTKHHSVKNDRYKKKENNEVSVSSSKDKSSHSNHKHSSSDRNRGSSHKSKESHRDKRKIDNDSDESSSRKKVKKCRKSRDEHHRHSRKNETSDEESEVENISVKTERLVDDSDEDDSSEEIHVNKSSSEDEGSNSDNSNGENSPEISNETSEESEEEIQVQKTDHRHHSKVSHSSSKHSHSSSSKHNSHRSSHSSKSHSKSSHSKESHGSREKHQSRSNDKERESHKSSSKSKDKHSHSTSTHSPSIQELIKENEKKVKREKDSSESSAKEVKPSSHKNIEPYDQSKEARKTKNDSSMKGPRVKIETNDDGSIDNECGASFGDALMGFDTPAKKKKKTVEKSVKSTSTTSESKRSKSSNSSSQSNPSNSSHSTDPFKQPDLLLRKPKEEPLDIDFLPEISPNYKPLPYVPEHIRKPVKPMNEEDTMFSIMTTKNQRTKVFSGNKSISCEVPSLYSLCIQLLYDNIDAVEYTGGVPYDILEPLLKKLNAQQLYTFETYNSYMIPDTAELWEFLCKKDFRNKPKLEMESWRDVYLRCMEERERKLKALTANISQSMAKSVPVRQTKLAYVDVLPRSIARKKAKLKPETVHSPLNGSSSSSNKTEILGKAIVGAHTPGVQAEEVVPPPPMPRIRVPDPIATQKKKKKAPLMAKALQLMKGNRR